METIVQIECYKCKKVKTIDEFYLRKNRSITDHKCKNCYAKYYQKVSKERCKRYVDYNYSVYHRHLNYFLEKLEQKKCFRCNRIKDFKEFYRNIQHRKNIDPYCKNCKNKINYKWNKSYKENSNLNNEQLATKQWRSKNTKKCKQYKKEYSLKNKNIIKENGKIYYLKHRDDIEIKNKKYTIMARIELKDSYIKRLLTYDSNLRAKDIPNFLVKAKRQQIKIEILNKQ